MNKSNINEYFKKFITNNDIDEYDTIHNIQLTNNNIVFK